MMDYVLVYEAKTIEVIDANQCRLSTQKQLEQLNDIDIFENVTYGYPDFQMLCPIRRGHIGINLKVIVLYLRWAIYEVNS